MPRAQHFFPASQMGNRSFNTILEQPVSLVEDWLHTAPALRSPIPLLFSDALLCQAFSSRSTIMQRPYIEIPSESLRDLVTLYHRGLRGGWFSVPSSA